MKNLQKSVKIAIYLVWFSSPFIWFFDKINYFEGQNPEPPVLNMHDLGDTKRLFIAYLSTFIFLIALSYLLYAYINKHWHKEELKVFIVFEILSLFLGFVYRNLISPTIGASAPVWFLLIGLSIPMVFLLAIARSFLKNSNNRS